MSLSRNTSGADGSITVCLIHQTRTRLKYSPSQCLQAVTRYWPVRVVLSELSLDPKCFSNHSPNVVPFFCSYPWRASAHQRNKKVWRLLHGIRLVGLKKCSRLRVTAHVKAGECSRVSHGRSYTHSCVRTFIEPRWQHTVI